MVKMLIGKKTWSWKCPECKRINKWTWDYHEIPVCGDVVKLECSHCKGRTLMECEMKRKR